MTSLKAIELSQRITELERLLKDARAVAAHERRRAEALEVQARIAWRVSLGPLAQSRTAGTG